MAVPARRGGWEWHQIKTSTGGETVPRPMKPIVRSYRHRDLPPVTAELMADYRWKRRAVAWRHHHHRDELWQHRYDELMANVADRLRQEITRLGGDYAHVHDGPSMCGTMTRRMKPGCTAGWIHMYRRALTRPAN